MQVVVHSSGNGNEPSVGMQELYACPVTEEQQALWKGPNCRSVSVSLSTLGLQPSSSSYHPSDHAGQHAIRVPLSARHSQSPKKLFGSPSKSSKTVRLAVKGVAVGGSVTDQVHSVQVDPNGNAEANAVVGHGSPTMRPRSPRSSGSPIRQQHRDQLLLLAGLKKTTTSLASLPSRTQGRVSRPRARSVGQESSHQQQQQQQPRTARTPRSARRVSVDIDEQTVAVGVQRRQKNWLPMPLATHKATGTGMGSTSLTSSNSKRLVQVRPMFVDVYATSGLAVCQLLPPANMLQLHARPIGTATCNDPASPTSGSSRSQTSQTQTGARRIHRFGPPHHLENLRVQVK